MQILPEDITDFGDLPPMLPKARKKQPAGDVLTQNVKTGSALPKSLREMAADYMQRGMDAYNADPDVSSLQQYARERSDEGESAMLNALAAQYAGKDFEPIQGQFLKKAMAAQEPLKVGNAGYLTSSGHFVKDPTYQSDRQAEVMLRHGQSLLTLAEQADRSAADRESRLEAARLRAALGGAGNESRVWRGEDTLRGAFDTQTKDLRDTLDSTSKISTILAPFAGRKLSDMPAIQQQSLVVLLNKFLDPGSVVREGEFDRVVQAQGLIGRAQNLMERIGQGKPLNADAIKQIGELADVYRQASEAKMRVYGSQFSDVASRRGFDVSNVIVDPRWRGGSAPSGGSSQTKVQVTY